MMKTYTWGKTLFPMTIETDGAKREVTDPSGLDLGDALLLRDVIAAMSERDVPKGIDDDQVAAPEPEVLGLKI